MNRRWIIVWGLAAGLTLFAGSSILRFSIQAGSVTDLWNWGFPFAYIESWGPCPQPGTCQEWRPALLALDLVIWLLVGFGLVFAVGWLVRRGSR